MSATDICNMALGWLGAKRITSLDDGSVQAIHCKLHYEQTRDALLRSHWWRFASARASLSQDTDTPDFEYDYQYSLPSDFLRLKSVFSENGTATENTRYSYAIEGNKILTDDEESDNTLDIRYIKRVTDTAQFDPLFTEVLILKLALKLVGPLDAGQATRENILNELKLVMPRVRALDRQETQAIGRLNNRPWTEARLQGGGMWRQDRV